MLTGTGIYDAFYDDYQTLRAFLHSHSFTGNPLGCTAALATLDLFDASDVLGHNRELAAQMAGKPPAVRFQVTTSPGAKSPSSGSDSACRAKKRRRLGTRRWSMFESGASRCQICRDG